MASNHVFDATKAKNAHRTVIDPDGKPAVEKRPIQRSVLALNPSGHVVWFPLHTGPAQLAKDDPYATRVTYEKSKWGTGKSAKPGFLFLDRCPQGTPDGYTNLPDSVRNRPVCRAGANGGPLDQRNPCQCILDTQKIRRAQNDAEQAALNKALKSGAERTAEAHAEAIAAARDAAAAAEKLARTHEPEKGRR